MRRSGILFFLAPIFFLLYGFISLATATTDHTSVNSISESGYMHIPGISNSEANRGILVIQPYHPGHSKKKEKLSRLSLAEEEEEEVTSLKKKTSPDFDSSFAISNWVSEAIGSRSLQFSKDYTLRRANTAVKPRHLLLQVFII